MVGKVQVVLEEGSAAVVVRNGIRIEFNASGSIEVYGNVPIVLHPATNEDSEPQGRPGPQIGELKHSVI